MGISSPPADDHAAAAAAVATAHGADEALEPMPFKFVTWGASADVSFWHRLADFKLDTQKLTEEAISISGMKWWNLFPSHAGVSSFVCFGGRDWGFYWILAFSAPMLCVGGGGVVCVGGNG